MDLFVVSLFDTQDVVVFTQEYRAENCADAVKKALRNYDSPVPHDATVVLKWENCRIVLDTEGEGHLKVG